MDEKSRMHPTKHLAGTPLDRRLKHEGVDTARSRPPRAMTRPCPVIQTDHQATDTSSGGLQMAVRIANTR
eukprot:23577-Eustigmatos_ZCMA.PRE.1